MTIKKIIMGSRLKLFGLGSLILVYVTMMTAGSYLMMYAINRMVSRNLQGFVIFISAAGTSLLIANVLMVTLDVLTERYFQQIIHQIRQGIVTAYINSSEVEKKNTSIGEQQNNLVENLNLLKNNFLHPIYAVAVQIGLLIFSVGSLFTFHWSLVIMVAVLLAIMMTVPNLFSKSLNQTTVDIKNRNGGFLAFLSKWLPGVYILKIYNSSHTFLKKSLDESSKLEDSYVERAKTTAKLNLVNLELNILSQVLVMGLAGILATIRIVTYGVVISAGNFADMIFQAVIVLSNSRGQIISSRSLIEEIDELMLTDTSAETEEKNTIKKIILKNMSYQYNEDSPKIRFSDDVITAGTKVAIIGKSGSGKSTLMNILMQNFEPTSGSISFINSSGENVKLAIDDYSYVPQTPFVFPGTVAENVTLFHEDLDDRVDSALNQVSLSEDIRKIGGKTTIIDSENVNLSGGQIQRITLARALIFDRKILFVDEGTSSSDSKTAASIVNKITSLSNEYTVFYIAHNLTEQELSRFDKVINMDDRNLIPE